MSHRNAVLQLYRNIFLSTKDCTDRSLKLYIRRRARQNFQAAGQLQAQEQEAEWKRLAQQAEVVRRQMQLRRINDS